MVNLAQFGQLNADRRLAQIEACRRPRHVAFAEQRFQRDQQVEIDPL